MKIKNIHVLSSYNNQVVLVNNNGVLELPGTKLKVSHGSSKGALKDFMNIVLKDLNQESVKVKEKHVKEVLKNFKQVVVRKNKDLILSGTKQKTYEATQSIAAVLFPDAVVHIATSDLKKVVANPEAFDLKLSDVAQQAIKKAIEKKLI